MSQNMSESNQRAGKRSKGTLQITAKKLAKTSVSADTNLQGRAPLDTMIATAAYYLAEQRGFAPGHELEDWFAAEQQIRRANS